MQIPTPLQLFECDLLVTEDAVIVALDKLASEITADLADQNPLFICCMNGALIFAGQLLTKLVFPLEIDYVHATRYGNATTGAALQWKAYPHCHLHGRVVVLLDDILDEGVTLAEIASYCKAHGAKKVLMAVLVEKLHLRKVTPGMKSDYTGIEIGDRFVFGYGLDYKGYWRNAPGIYAVKEKH